MKKVIAICLMVLAVLGLSGCSNDQKKLVAISFDSRWQSDGNALKESLEKDGFIVNLEYADTVEQQNEQIKELTAMEPRCILVGAIDSNSMADSLADAKNKKIPIIAYGRLIMNTDAVSYYATFDGTAVGEAMGEYLEDTLQLKKGSGPYYIEFFAGAPTDNNAPIFLEGSLKVLQPYIDNGQLVVPSGVTSFDEVSTKDWDPKYAQERMQKLLTAYPEDANLAAIICPNDGIAAGLRETLKASGYTKMPKMTGLDAEAQALKAIAEGEQTMTVYKRPSDLIAKTIRMIKAVVEGSEPDINDVISFDNGVVTVPAYLCTPWVIDKSNIGIVK